MIRTLCQLIVVAALIGQPAYGWNQKDTIAEIKVISGNQTVIKFVGAPWHGCSASPFFVISEGDSVPTARKQMLAIALTALTAGKDVWIVTGTSGGNSPGCNASGYEWVYQLSIYP